MTLIIQRSKPEEDIIEGCRKQQASAQRMLYERHSGKMLGVCKRYIRDNSEAEQVMVGGFVKIFQVSLHSLAYGPEFRLQSQKNAGTSRFAGVNQHYSCSR